MPDCGVHYLWFAFVCFFHEPPPPPNPLQTPNPRHLGTAVSPCGGGAVAAETAVGPAHRPLQMVGGCGGARCFPSLSVGLYPSTYVYSKCSQCNGEVKNAPKTGKFNHNLTKLNITKIAGHCQFFEQLLLHAGGSEDVHMCTFRHMH